MTKIQMAHLRVQGINFAVFNADSQLHTGHARQSVLDHLTFAAQQEGLRVDKSALAFRSCGKTQFYGTPDLVRYLSSAGVPRWTHTITI
mgnify:CR=1 FL=1